MCPGGGNGERTEKERTMAEDTIAAIATANGCGGVAVVRLSGPDALKIAGEMFVPAGKTAVLDFLPYRMYPGVIRAEHFDDYGLCVCFRSPHSYTGEDVVELHCHGGVQISNGILKRAFDLGARPAAAGEFTRRAFLNGKMTLAAAEGLADMINASSESMIRAGYALYRNELTARVRAVQQQLTHLLAGLEAGIDYPEEDLQDSLPALTELGARLQETCAALQELLRTYEKVGRLVKNGVSVAIVGLPNAGKSSLLNAILGYDKAIVSDIEGTTRDIVEGEIELDGTLFRLYDTAGIRESADAVERAGVEKAERLTESADIVLHVVDASGSLRTEDEKLSGSVRRAGRLLHLTVFNKCDLPAGNAARRERLSGDDWAEVSARTGGRVEELLRRLSAAVRDNYVPDGKIVVEERHYRALQAARGMLERAAAGAGQIPLDMLTVDISQAWQKLGEITGETANEEIIGEIFSKFCVGK